MFYLKNPDNDQPNIFPPGVKDKICVDFTCNGRQCSRRAKDIDKEDVQTIAAHFKKHNSGWLSKFHFKAEGLCAEVEAMMGDHTGTSTR